MSKHDLDQILAEVLTHFEPLPEIRISWATKPIDPDTFNAAEDWGSCVKRDGVHYIGISPELKRAPKYVVEHIVRHEVLHVALPPRGRLVHHKAFRIAERMCPGYRRAWAWLCSHQ